MKKILLITLLIGFNSFAGNYVMAGKTVYHIFNKKNSILLVSKSNKIYLYNDCSTSSVKLGKGSWGYESTGQISILFPSNKMKLGKPVVPFNLTKCSVSTLDNIINTLERVIN